MKIKVPDYFVKFRCIADQCKDSCCIGWEIDIDDITKAKYQALNTEIGREIVEKTKHGCFPLDAIGRCAFLDENGLCRIISAHGDGYLCDICREHPRYYGVGKYGIEGGLGLGCEEAADIILSLDKLPKLIETEREVHYFDEDFFSGISDHFRVTLYNCIFAHKIEDVAGAFTAYSILADSVSFEASTSGTEVSIPTLTASAVDYGLLERLYSAFFDSLYECEALTDDWNEILNKANDIKATDSLEILDEHRGLLYYFTHRYVREGVEDISLGQRILFSLCSSLAISAISKVINGDDAKVRSAVLYSKNIEYSTDNVEDRKSVV